ncbi:MAG: 6-pyruvoyl-tetrahydropterin synthase-related protein [Pseudobdellovibrionaceae bacterium]
MKKYFSLDDVLLWLVTFVLVGFVAFETPRTVWNTEPATGGDTASHFYPLHVLVKEGIPQLSLRTWNPGNLMGEPHLLHYFPGPYLIMAFLSLFVPIGLAFNIGTILPLLVFPLTVYVGLRGLGIRFFGAVVASCFALLFAFNESFSMWGGNSMSLLAGQFAHMYALNFLFLTLGLIGYELRQQQNLYGSTLLVMAVCISHSYILLLIPFFFLGFIFTFPLQDSGKMDVLGSESRWSRFKYLFWVGLWGIILSLWFIVPQILNAPWTTGNPMAWYFENFWRDVFPEAWRPVFWIFAGILPVLTFFAGRDRKLLKEFLLSLGFWTMPILACIAMFFVFPKLGLVDARVIPQIQLFLFLLMGIWLGLLIEKFPKVLSWVVLAGACGAILFWTHKNIKNYPHWVKWNYSSWSAKNKYAETQEVFKFLKGDFSQPRIANEHHPSLNDAGTTRVFEMTPYFARRATMESLYQEAAHTAPITHWLQARISDKPSCPIRGWDCPRMDFKGLDQQMKVLGVQDLILTSPEAFAKVNENPKLQMAYQTASLRVYRLNEPIRLVETLTVIPEISFPDGFQRRFLEWLKNYQPGSAALLVPRAKNFQMSENFLDPEQKCQPQVTADYNRIELKTHCPGKIHVLKFTYHPAWKASGGEDLHMISPGFIAFVPDSENVELKFGPSFSWYVAGLISLIAFVYWMLQAWAKTRKNKF